MDIKSMLGKILMMFGAFLILSKKEINFKFLRSIVDDAIKKKDISKIEAMDGEKQKNELKYMQKYSELQVSKNELAIGYYAIVLAFFAIGISYWLVNSSELQKLIFPYIGNSFVAIAVLLLFLWQLKYKPDIEFMHKIILKIEEKLP